MGASGCLWLISSKINAALNVLVHILLHEQLFLWDDSQETFLGPFTVMVTLPPFWESERCQPPSNLLSMCLPSFFKTAAPSWRFGTTVECSITCTLVRSDPLNGLE